MVSGISFSDAVQLLVTYQYKLGNATKHLQKSVDSVTHDLQDGFDDFLTKTFLPRIYDTAEIQELPKATPEVQAAWISNLRKRLYLSEIEQGNVEKKQEPARYRKEYSRLHKAATANIWKLRDRKAFQRHAEK